MFAVIIVGFLVIIGLAWFVMAEAGSKAFGLIPFLLGAAVLIMACIYQQDPGESIVIQSPGGKIIEVDESDGFGFTAPWNKTISFNLRNQILDFDNQDSALKDSSSAKFDIVVTYSIRGNCVGEVYTKYQSQERLEKDILRPGIRSALKAETVKFEPLTVLENRPSLTTNVRDAIVEKFSDECVVIDGVDIVDIQLPSSIQQAIADRNAATIAVQKAEEEYKKSQVLILQQLNEAKAASDKVAISQCGGREIDVTETVNGKEVVNTKIVPNPPEQCQNLINPETIAIKQIEAMAEIGKAGNMIIVSPDGTMPIINATK